MTPIRTVESGKTSPIARPSPSQALTAASHFSKCKSQSLIESKKLRLPSATNARAQKTRHQSVVCIRTTQHGLASPTEGLNQGRAIVCADRYSKHPGDHSPKASKAMGAKWKSKAMSKYCLGHDGEMSSTAEASETTDHLPSDSWEHQGDNNPSTSSLVPIVQVSKHVGNPQESINSSTSGNGLETTWPSWSSDKSYKGSKDRKRYTVGQPKTSRQMTASLNGKFKALANLAIKSKSSSPTKAPLPKIISSTGNSPKKKLNSSNICFNSLNSFASTIATDKVDCPVVSRSTSPVKAGCKLTLRSQVQKKDDIMLNPSDSWDSLSPRCDCRGRLSSYTEKNALHHSAIKRTDTCESGRSGSPGLIRVSTSTVASVCRQRFTTKNFPTLKRKLSFSPSVMENVQTAKSAENKINRSLKNNSSIGSRLSTNWHLLKVSRTNRGDRSTDSGYQESVSRATSDWYTAFGLISSERHFSKRSIDSMANMDPRFDPPTYFSNGSPLSTQTALYSIEEQNRSFHSLASTQMALSTVDVNLDMSTAQPTDYQSVQMSQQNKSLCPFVDELHNVSSRYLQTSEVVGNSDQTFEQISESALTVDMVEDELKLRQDVKADGSHQEARGVVDNSICISDTCGLVSEIFDNNSDVTDISTDWDAGPSCQESNPEALKSPKKEHFARRDSFQIKDAKSHKKQSLRKSHSPSSKDRKAKEGKSHSPSSKDRKAKEGVMNFELSTSPEISIKEESSMQELSYSTAFLARGFNSNTRRTVEINYDLITMNDTTSRVFNGNTPTLSDGPGSRVSQRSLSAPSVTESYHDKCTPNDLGVDDDLVKDSRNTNIRSRLRLITFSHALDHCCWSNMASAIDRNLASYCSADFPEPILFYLGCLFILTMCVVLAFVLTYSFIG